MSEVTTIQTARERMKKGDEQAAQWVADFDRQRAQYAPQDAAQQKRIYDRAHRQGAYAPQS